MWYIGVVGRVSAKAGGKVEVTVFFEDGEEAIFTCPDPEESIFQLPAKWSDTVVNPQPCIPNPKH